jgi:hypothetical protein
MMKRWLVLDVSNLLWRSFHANPNIDEEDVAGMAHHMALQTMNKMYRDNRPVDRIVMAMDRSSWRKEYTASEACLSKKPYKGNRRQNMTPKQQERYGKFKNHVREFEQIIADHTSIVALQCDRLEADDLIAGFVQMHPDDEIVIISADKDMIQLLDHPHVTLIDPMTGKKRGLEEWDGDVGYFLFEKNIRGDLGDNVCSAYPRVRSARIRKAYDDAYELVSLMNETWTDGKNEFIVKHLYRENELLMDLKKQPADIRELIINTITTEMAKQKKYSHFHFLKFCGQYKLKKIVEGIDNYLPMLSR